MLPKKNPNADPKRNSWLFFQLGLVAVLVVTFIAIEIKTFDKEFATFETTYETVDLVEDVPITITKDPALPPPPKPNEVIQIIDDTSSIDDETIESFEDNPVQPEAIVRAEDIVFIKEPPKEEDFTFTIIEDIPLFPGCEKVAKEKRRECFLEKIHQHIRKNFSYPDTAMDAGVQGKVFVSFIIDKEGVVSISNLRGPDKSLEKEAERIISKLPKMTPGKQRGKPVRMTMSIPITFKLDK